MPVKSTKLLGGAKHGTVLATYTTGAAVAPATGHLSAYVDLAVTDQHREVEVSERLKDLINRAREEDYRRPSSTTCYYYMALNGSRASILFSTNRLLILEGMVAIGIEGSIRGGGKGSLLFDSCWKEMLDWANEQGRLTV
jgi:hypothetical protein